ncbi:NAD(P)/FAD-dependent oxidoreductase [Sporomusa acidovorans]|uniref:Thioredoxin reductase n=1 Tax=Sporomusa acidovorans (strain ATCC 49682 / DSM 3132 / Mol) TaxID=1123286 RepID=A0ABZ3JBJ1_SPOA4|nr:NAD(P)/FAD-dependent oxidoreductase [Sporomusa acidovorans]OZC21673.1 thioredoxin reductase [Sporomusa acidovorans DSM 3132]SDD60467.1 thioredoxin reductase (NADPH) [Sporomusa acidovorans]
MAEDDKFDIAIIGGGPAGLSAALTGRIRNKKIAVFEHLDFSEKLQKAHLVDNYLGLPEVSGKGLMQHFSGHVLAHKPRIVKEKVMNVFPGENMFTLLTPKATYEAKAIIIATGVVSTLLFEGERDLLGRGVSYCATCDGRMFEGKDVAVISYTAEGENEIEFLGELCRSVYFLPQYKADFSRMRAPVKVLAAKPKAIVGDGQVEKLVTDQEELKVHGVFIMRQSDPVENLLPGLELDGEVIKVNRDLSTSIPGVFAAGDCTGKPWQIAKATGEGLVAVLSAITYIDKL